MKCARPKCPNLAKKNGRQQGFCSKHYDTAPVRGFVDGDPVRERVELLIARGIGRNAIEQRTGLSVRWILKSTGRVQKRTANLIFAIPLPTRMSDSACYMPSLGTARRIQALAAIGWPLRELGPKIDRAASNASAVMRRTTVRTRTAAAYDELYRRLLLTPGPSDAARRFARAQGWQPPLAWDDIDDPDEQPNLGADTKLSFPERYLELREHVGLNHQQIADVMGIELDSLERQLHRYDMFKGRAA